MLDSEAMKKKRSQDKSWLDKIRPEGQNRRIRNFLATAAASRVTKNSLNSLSIKPGRGVGDQKSSQILSHTLESYGKNQNQPMSAFQERKKLAQKNSLNTSLQKNLTTNTSPYNTRILNVWSVS